MPYFNRFDICEAYYVFAMLYHGGQWSKEYRIFGRLQRIKYEPRNLNDERDLNENAKEIFLKLVYSHTMG